MMDWLRKYRYTIFMITLGGMLVGIFVQFGSGFLQLSPYDAAIVVNGDKISYKEYQSRLEQYRRNQQENKTPATDENINALKQKAVQDLVQETVLGQEADKYGMQVTDNEVASYIQSAPAFQKSESPSQRLRELP